MITMNENSITLTLTDGASGDADGVVNGTIIDPSGIAFPINTNIENATSDEDATQFTDDQISGEKNTVTSENSGGSGTVSILALLILLMPCIYYRRII